MRAVQRIVNEMNQKSKYYQYLSVTWIEPKILKRQAREAAEAAAKAAQEGEGNE